MRLKTSTESPKVSDTLVDHIAKIKTLEWDRYLLLENREVLND